MTNGIRKQEFWLKNIVKLSDGGKNIRNFEQLDATFTLFQREEMILLRMEMSI